MGFLPEKMKKKHHASINWMAMGPGGLENHHPCLAAHVGIEPITVPGPVCKGCLHF